MDCVILECGRKRGPIQKIKRPTETVQERPVRWDTEYWMVHRFEELLGEGESPED